MFSELNLCDDSFNQKKPPEEPNYSIVVELNLHDLPVRLGTLGQWFFLSLIRFYQMTISRGLPADTCRFYPSCSHYAYQAIYKYGAIRGVVMAIWRLLRCNPFNPGGFDPVP